MPPDRGDGPPTGLNALIIRCKCSNIRVELLIYTGDGLKEGGGEVDAWISGESEEIVRLIISLKSMQVGP